MPFVAKTLTGAGAFAACYIPWPVPESQPGLRWWPVLAWAGAWVLADTLRWEREDPDDSYDIATTSDYGIDDEEFEGEE